MTKIYTKGSTAVDEILLSAERYNIKTDGGVPINSNVQIELATTVTQAGTPITAQRINNMENGIDNLDTLVDLWSKTTPIETEIEFTSPTKSKVFTIADANVSVGQTIFVYELGKQATGKQQDEHEMDSLILKGVCNAGSVTIYAQAVPGPVSGKFKIAYQVVETYDPTKIITLDASFSTSVSPSATITLSTTVTNVLNRILVAVVSKRNYGGTAVSSIVRNGQNFVKAGGASAAAGDYPASELWYLVNPDVGTYNTVCTLGGSDFAQFGVLAYHNVNQTEFGTLVTATGNSTTPYVSAIDKANDTLVAMMASKSGSLSLTPNADQTAIFNLAPNPPWRGTCSTRTGIDNASIGWTFGSAAEWAIVALPLKTAS